jgi:hypothetical protein
MRIVPGIILAATLVLSSYAGTVTLPSGSWVSFTPIPPYDFSWAVSSNPLSCLSDSTDFYWKYYEGCTCMCFCCPSIAVASKRPFYVSRQAMDYGDYKGDTAMLADTTLFVKCSTSTYSIGISCPVPFSSASLVTAGNYGLVPGGADSLYTRLLVFRTRFNYYLPLRYIPLKIDRIVSRDGNCPYAGMTATFYDSIQVTFGNTLTGTAIPARGAPGYRNALHISTTGAGYVISGFGEGKGRLEILNGQGKTVYCPPVLSSPCVIGKNILGPGIYFIQVHSKTGISSIVLPVH